MLFDVHQWLPIRVKVSGIEAADHRAAIAAVESMDALTPTIARAVTMQFHGETISSIELDEGAPASAWLVDQVGNDQNVRSEAYYVAPSGTLIPAETSARAMSGLLPAMFSHYPSEATRTTVASALGHFSLAEALEYQSDDLLPPFLVRMIGDADGPEALRRLDALIAQLQQMRADVAQFTLASAEA